MKNVKDCLKFRNGGITLIALVITIIVLLILAGVSIATLTGENGILTRANDAKEKTEQAQKDEENILNSYEDKLNEYTGIDWDTVLANAEKHPDQKTSTAIGVGTDGKAVNMDLWKYTLLDDGTFGLNTKNGLDDTGNSGRETGYIGQITDEGTIIGKVPMYISEDDGNTFLSVTSLVHTFYNLTELKIAPDIPSTVTNMNVAFWQCTNLEETSIIPDSVQTMQYTFGRCTNLKTVQNIGNGVIDMKATFYNCSTLEKIDNIPDNVENMRETFKGCISLKSVPTIPESVIILYQTFYNCQNLTGTIIINANINNTTITSDLGDYHQCFYGATTVEGGSLNLLCTEQVYNLFYDETSSNLISNKVCDENSNITLTKK